MQSLSLQLSYHTFKGTQRAFVLFLLLVGVLPGLPTCMSYSALPLLCDVAWASSSKFNAKVKQSDYVLGSIKVVVLILLFFFSLFWSVFTNGHTITQYSTENVWGYTIKWTQIWYPYHELHALTKLTNIISERI